MLCLGFVIPARHGMKKTDDWGIAHVVVAPCSPVSKAFSDVVGNDAHTHDLLRGGIISYPYIAENTESYIWPNGGTPAIGDGIALAHQGH